MGKGQRAATIIVTADWNEVNNRDGFRPLKVELNPFLQSNKSGGLRPKGKQRLEFQVQIIDRKPEISSQSTQCREPKRLSINFCPALRQNDLPDEPPITPFKDSVDHTLRQGLTCFHLIPNPQELEPSDLWDVRDAERHRPFRARFRYEGSFDFMIGLAIDETILDGEGNKTVERRRFRTDPEMDVDCTSTGACGGSPPRPSKRRRR